MEYKIVVSQPEKTGTPYQEQPIPQSTILFLTANPIDTQVIKINKEFNDVLEESEAATHPLKLRLRLDVGQKELVEIFLRDKPTILHFSGHGLGEKGLILQSESGKAELLSTEAFSNLIAEFADSIQCIVLNACYSEEQAKSLAKHIPYVIGVDNAIGDEKAITFSRAFYTCLFLGEGYESAFRKAVVQVGVQNMAAGAQPVLYRWDPAVSEVVKENTNPIIVPEEEAVKKEAEITETNVEPKTKMETAALEMQSISPKAFPAMSFLIPKSHKIIQNTKEYFSSEDELSFLDFGIYDEFVPLKEILSDTLKEEGYKKTGNKDTEIINGLKVEWLEVSDPEYPNYTYYILAFETPDNTCGWATIAHVKDSPTATAYCGEMFESFEYKE